MKTLFTRFALHHPGRVAWALTLSTLVLLLLAGLPSIWPGQFGPLHGVEIDTDPENMLSEDEPVRVFHDEAKERFGLYDMVVVGITNDQHPQGVFNRDSLGRVYELTEFARGLQWQGEDGERRGVIEVDMIAPSMVDNIEQGGLGSVEFSWLMPGPPASDEEALAVLERAQRIPFLNGTLVSDDGRALALYLPITHKDTSYRIRRELLDFTADWDGSGDAVHITGLPVAEDTFGVEMFIQMAISAPLAMLVIFLLLWWFFKKLVLVTAPMIVAMVCALATMALLIISGNTVHIMSSMIPIFIMPIAVLDAVHILSEFFDRYPIHKDRRRTIEEVIDTLFAPMLFTTLTTMAGFASLALTPIPPVQVFGVFVAIGVFMAWFWTIVFIPAFIMLIPEHKLEGYGHHVGEDEEDRTLMGRALQGIGHGAAGRPGLVVALTLLAVAIAGYGISQIVINDNPTKWFAEDHPIRVADRVLNDHFAGTYMAYLEIAPDSDQSALDRDGLVERLDAWASERGSAGDEDVYARLAEAAGRSTADTRGALLEDLQSFAEAQLDREPDRFFAWDDALLFLDAESQRSELFKQPEVLRWLDSLQDALVATDVVGKANSLTDVVKTVHRELLLGEPAEFRIPDSANAVGQTLITFQNSHRPQDLWHFVTPDYRHSVLWLQLSSGDNRDMERVIDALDGFLADNPPPLNLETHWFGLTYINVVWQGKMVNGMLEAFLGSFAVVLVMMIVLFRSPLWGVLSMIPLLVTVGGIYGVIGLIGKDYDMPVAVLSALSLGLAIDYAIHFVARSRRAMREHGGWSGAVRHVYGEPARAITRNAIVLAAGFLPLLAAPLVPYQTVGVFIAAIIVSAGLATLLILPALVTLLQRWLSAEPTSTGSK